MMKNYPPLLRKFMTDKAKVPLLVEIIIHMDLELYSLKRQDQVGLPLQSILFTTKSQSEGFSASFSRPSRMLFSLLKKHSLNMMRRMLSDLVLKLLTSVPLKVGESYKILPKVNSRNLRMT